MKDGLQSSRVIPIYPTPAKFVKTFCPVFILTNYLKARHGLGMVDDDAFLFPKVESTFEHGTNNQILTLAEPAAPIPTASFLKKFKQHVESDDLRKVGVTPTTFTPDSLTLGGKLCLVNGVVYPDFNTPSPAPVGSLNSPLPSRKRISPANVSSTSAKSVTSTNPKVRVIQAPGHPPASVPIPLTSEREAPQNFESSNDDLHVFSART